MEEKNIAIMIEEARAWSSRTKRLDYSSSESRRFSFLKKIVMRASRLFMNPQSEVNQRVLDILALLVEVKLAIPQEIQGSQDTDTKIPEIYRRVFDCDPNEVSLSIWKEYINRDNISCSQIESELRITVPYISQSIDKFKVLLEFPNFRIYAMRSDHSVAHEMILHKRWEEHMTALFLKVLKPGDVFLDLGANIGYFTLLAASIVKDSGKVIAFEPNYLNTQLMFSSIKENQFTNVVIYPFAASDTNSILAMGTGGSNGMIIENDSQKVRHLFAQSIIVDDLLKSEQKIDAIKMDVELHEPFALRGMDKIIKKYRPVIFTEFHPLHLGKDYLEQIIQYNYRLSIVDERLESLGELIESPNSDFVMDFWQQLNTTKHLDLFAYPLESID